MHSIAVHAHHWLGQETGREAHFGCYLAADQLIKLNLVGGRHYFAIAVIDLELRGRNFRMIFLILKTHGALHFRSGVNEGAEGISRQRMIVAASIYVLEFAGFVVTALGV